jgi:hypothetical protein
MSPREAARDTNRLTGILKREGEAAHVRRLYVPFVASVSAPGCPW